MSKPSTDGILVVGSKYKVEKVLGEGSFGVLRRGKNLETGEPVAIKFELKNISNPQLPLEYLFYKKLGNHASGIPKLFYFAPVPGSVYHCLIMELLGLSLEKCFDQCERIFSLKTVLMIAIQLLDRLEYVHSKGIINRDIKPDNFMTGIKGPTEKIIHIIDFGLAKFYMDMDMEDGKHIELKTGTSHLLGTPRYMSINAHKHVTLSRRDDLEALGYILIYFLNGELPWQGLKSLSPDERATRIGEIKTNISIDDLCRRTNGVPHPRAFAKYLSYVRALGFKETPNYEMLRKQFRDCFDEKGYGDDSDHRFDWEARPSAGPYRTPSSGQGGLKQQVSSNAKFRRF